MKSQLTQLLRKNKRLFFCLVAGDLIVLALHLLLGTHDYFYHLDFEKNLPTLYQSGKLFFFGLFFLFLGVRKKSNQEMRRFILPLAVFFIFLGLDEILQIHENVYRAFEYFSWLHPRKIVDASTKIGYRSSLWILYYLPFIFIFIFWSGYWFRYFQAKMKNNAWIIILSSFCFFTVLFTEILSSTGSYSANTYYWLITVEETGEMFLASTLVLVGSKMVNKYKRSPRKPPSPPKTDIY